MPETFNQAPALEWVLKEHGIDPDTTDADAYEAAERVVAALERMETRRAAFAERLSRVEAMLRAEADQVRLVAVKLPTPDMLPKLRGDYIDDAYNAATGALCQQVAAIAPKLEVHLLLDDRNAIVGSHADIERAQKALRDLAIERGLVPHPAENGR